MSENFLGEIRAFAGSFAPRGWLPCNGQLLDIRTNIALFNLLGTQYGGDGVNNFAVPNLKAALIMGAGTDPATGTQYNIGETTSQATVSLTASQMPAHTHKATFAPANGNLSVGVTTVERYGGQSSPQDNMLSQSGLSALAAVNTYATTPSDGSILNGVTASGGAFGGGAVGVATVGGGSISIMPPYQTITYMIATSGLFPVRS